MNAGPVAKRLKRSVAILVRRNGRLLVVRRPDDDDELPGIWGLPAGSYRGVETLDELVERIGRAKLGVPARAGAVLAAGRADRAGYLLDMTLVEASIPDEPNRGEWKWETSGVLGPGRDQGSLCCRLALDIEEAP